MSNKPGPLVIIGGHEDKEGDRVILNEVAGRLGSGHLVIATVASHQPAGYFDAYREAFAPLGVTDLIELYIDERGEALDGSMIDMLTTASGIFFTGGDQMRIASQIGDTPIERAVRDLHDRGGVVAGTSAGAAIMSETMLVKGSSDESHRIGNLQMAPGFGLIRDVIIDQHFAERGRIGRLLGAVAQKPRVLGIGIDEDTAIVEEGGEFRVVGAGAVTVVDGASVTHSNIAEALLDRTLSMHNVRLHVLSSGDTFDLVERAPLSNKSAA